MANKDERAGKELILGKEEKMLWVQLNLVNRKQV
jgi:hypothetical protein